MCRSGMSICLLVSLILAASAARVNGNRAKRVEKHHNSGGKSGIGGPHKCTITWKFRENAGVSQVARVSFGVSGCRTQCLATNSDVHYDKMFAVAFKPELDGQFCKCMHSYHNSEYKVISFPTSSDGQCSPDAGAAKCWNDYKVLSTDTLEEHAMGRKDLLIVHHAEEHAEREFAYDDVACEPNGCAGEEDCFESELPGLIGGRSDEQKKIIGNTVQQLLNGDITEDDLGDAEKNIIDGLTDDDRDEVLALADVVAKDPPGPEDDLYNAIPSHYDFYNGPITVGMLKEHYEKRLDGTGLSVPHLLAVAGIPAATQEDLDKELTKEMFKIFLKPECPSQFQIRSNDVPLLAPRYISA